jgi:hypothetical protein
MCERGNNEAHRDRCGLFCMLFQLVVLYAILVFGGGTLKSLDHPIAIETGRVFHTIAFVEPTIHWAEAREFDALAGGLRVLSHGIEIHRFM